MNEPKFKEFNRLVKFFTSSKVKAITLAPFGIYVNQKYSTVEDLSPKTKNHESIHWDQQIEMFGLGTIIVLVLVVTLLLLHITSFWILSVYVFPYLFFYIWYLIEWIIKGFTVTGSAYRAISFEREAFDNEYDFDYRKTRKRFAWVKKIFKK